MGAEAVLAPQQQQPEFVEHALVDGFGPQADHRVAEALGAALGIVLGVANKFLAVEGNPVVDELIAMMPGSNCGQCGFPGCSGAANAIVDGTAPATCCPPTWPA